MRVRNPAPFKPMGLVSAARLAACCSSETPIDRLSGMSHPIGSGGRCEPRAGRSHRWTDLLHAGPKMHKVVVALADESGQVWRRS